MTNDRMTRWLGPLALGYVVALVLGFFVIGPTSTPGQNASGAEVVAFYRDHMGQNWASLYVIGIGLALLTFFVSGLRTALREANPTHRWLANASFGGGLIYIAGFAFLGMNHLVLVEAAQNRNPVLAAQTNFIDQQYPVPVFLGMVVMTLAVGVLILAGSTLPQWLGWLSIVVAVVSATPLGFVGFLAFPIWATILGFMCARAHPDPEAMDVPGPVSRPRQRLLLRHHH